MEAFGKFQKLLESFEGKVHQQELSYALDCLGSIKDYTNILLQGVQYIDVNNIDPNWTEVGYGHVGFVYASKYGGSKVAIKIFKDESKSKIREGKILYSLSHENIVAFRGIGYISEQKAKNLNILVHRESQDDILFLVMEFIDQNLFKYVDSVRTLERKGLKYDMVWNIGQQITKALVYLHNLGIVHRDLKPDNILLDVGPKALTVKVADFGLATDSNLINISPPLEKTMSTPRGSSYRVNIRWGAPEIRSNSHQLSIEDFKAADMYCVGNILVFTLTGVRPHSKVSTFTLKDREDFKQAFIPTFPKSLKGPLKNVLSECLRENPCERPSASAIMKDYFSADQNPYLLNSNLWTDMTFFSCGFMDKTDILVADCCIDREVHSGGFYDTNIRIQGYDHETLKCPIDVNNAPRRDRPERWQWETEYINNLSEFVDLSNQKVIDNNPTTALKSFTFDKFQNKIVEIKLKQSDYIHHRAMRKIWLEYSNEQKIDEIPSKAYIHPYFSNTFALHIAVLTNEGPHKRQKFIFPRRAQRAGMPAPGTFTCGAVESASKPDYKVNNDGSLYVDLINTAARGFQEELGLELSGNDLKAICLTTVYLKFDTHEWGLCGFVDLKDERIEPKNRISADTLKDMFSTGPKDKFEHQTLTFIDFDLTSMIEFIFNNHENFASSTKLVVVKVLEAFFGKQKVKREFEMYGN